MKKLLLVTVATFIFLCLSAVTTYCLSFWTTLDAVKALGIGAGVFVASAVVALLAKKHISGNIVSSVLSAVALGFFIRAWYIYRDYSNQLWVIVLVSLACVAYLWIFYGLKSIPLVQRHSRLFFWIFFALSVVGYILVVVFTTTTYVSTFGYYMIVVTAFIFVLCYKSESVTDTVRHFTLATFSVLVVGIIVTLIMASGDVDLDFLDFGAGGIDSKSKKKKLNK